MYLYKQQLADFQEILLQEEKKQIDFLDEDYEVYNHMNVYNII